MSSYQYYLLTSISQRRSQENSSISRWVRSWLPWCKWVYVKAYPLDTNTKNGLSCRIWETIYALTTLPSLVH